MSTASQLRTRLRVNDRRRDAESVRLLGVLRDGVAAGNRLLLVDQHVDVAFKVRGVDPRVLVRDLRAVADGVELWAKPPPIETPADEAGVSEGTDKSDSQANATPTGGGRV